VSALAIIHRDDRHQSMNEPAPDTTHRAFAELERAFGALTAPPKDVGRVVLIVCRHAPGNHEGLQQSFLTPEEGVPGDEWNRRLPRHPDAQLTVMRRDIAELVGNGQPLTTPGDNLIVDLDLSTENLPIGSRLEVGDAVVEVTPKPHNGCSKFAHRFGHDALRFVNASATRHYNLRGIYWKVITPGEVRVGAPIRVLSR
jgi:MOSC domain-containing protein YiiM